MLRGLERELSHVDPRETLSSVPADQSAAGFASGERGFWSRTKTASGSAHFGGEEHAVAQLVLVRNRMRTTFRGRPRLGRAGCLLLKRMVRERFRGKLSFGQSVGHGIGDFSSTGVTDTDRGSRTERSPRRNERPGDYSPGLKMCRFRILGDGQVRCFLAALLRQSPRARRPPPMRRNVSGSGAHVSVSSSHVAVVPTPPTPKAPLAHASVWTKYMS